MTEIIESKRGIASMIGMLIVLLILAFLMYRLSRTNPAPKTRLNAAGTAGTNFFTAADTAKQRVDDANIKTRDLQKHVETIE